MNRLLTVLPFVLGIGTVYLLLESCARENQQYINKRNQEKQTCRPVCKPYVLEHMTSDGMCICSTTTTEKDPRGAQ